MPESLPDGLPPDLCLTPAFAAALAAFDLAALARQPDTICGLDADLRLAFLNPAWFAFAAANGGEPAVTREWGLGRSVLEACPPVLRDFYAQALAAALAQEQRWDHDYECSSPGKSRRMRMSAYPLPGRAGLLVVHALVAEAPHDAAAAASLVFDAATYTDAHGIVHQCAHCRKVRRTSGPPHWDWVLEYVENPGPMISHDLCDACLDFYYPDPGEPAPPD